MTTSIKSAEAETRFVDVSNRRIAYRTIGAGKPLVLLVRYRGAMDDWDSLFLDNLVTSNDYTDHSYPTKLPTCQHR